MPVTDILSLLQNPEGTTGQQQAPYPQGAQVGGNYLQGFIQNLAQIVQGVQQSASPGGNPWESPMSMDVSNLMRYLPSIIGAAAYHGSPYAGIKKFDTSKIGTGEGAQSFGWGHYFTSLKEIAEKYRSKLAPSDSWYDDVLETAVDNTYDIFQGKNPDKMTGKAIKYLLLDNAKEVVATADSRGMTKAAQRIKSVYESMDASLFSSKGGEILYNGKPLKESFKGAFYKVDIPDDDMLLHWDKPISQQSESVRKSLLDNKVVSTDKHWEDGAQSGEALYRNLAYEKGSTQAASLFLDSIGIPGHRYPSGTLSPGPSGAEEAYNYVMYNPEKIKVLEEASSLAEYEKRMKKISQTGGTD